MACRGNILTASLADVLPEGQHFKYHHVSSHPTRCTALYSATPGQKPEKTYCESHFLLLSLQASIRESAADVAVFAIEVLIYTSASLTTLFVSKADSTGFLPLATLPRGCTSPLRAVTSAFISHLVRPRHRADRKLVVSLFARAQDQYLFPGSIENGRKHVLDDRGLIRWWCKALNPILHEGSVRTSGTESVERDRLDAKAYLLVPGQEGHETRGYFPSGVTCDINSRHWLVGHPLSELRGATLQPRCLIPHFPDDPKSRFLDELDEELAGNSHDNSVESPSKRRTGHWNSVKTLEQFWEMMAFRQECASGRLVGFIWIVFSPLEADCNSGSPSTSVSAAIKGAASPQLASDRSPSRTRRTRKVLLTGHIIPRAPRVKVAVIASSQSKTRPEMTKHYHWTAETRGTLVLEQKAYTRSIELLLRLDFASIDVARSSTGKWVHETAVIAGLDSQDRNWGVAVTGRKRHQTVQEDMHEAQSDEQILTQNPSTAVPVNVLKTKRKTLGDAGGSLSNIDKKVNVESGIIALDAATVRKKAKVEQPGNMPYPESGLCSRDVRDDRVKMLGSSVIRKKAKSN